MSSFYGTARVSLGTATSWYSDAELRCFGPQDSTGDGVAGLGAAAAVRDVPVAQSYGGTLISRDEASGHAAGTSSTSARAGGRPAGGSSGQPSFYGQGPRLCLPKSQPPPPPVTASQLPRAPAVGQTAGRSSPLMLEAPEEGKQAVAPGEPVSVLPKRPPRDAACRALDKEIAACTAPDEAFAVALRDESALDGANWANLIYALAHFKKHSASSGSTAVTKDPRWRKSCLLLQPHLSQLTSRDAANVLWSLATLNARGEPLYMDTADALCSGGKLSVCDPVSVSKAAWALTSVANRDRRLGIFSHLAVPVVLRAEAFPVGALTMTCYAFAKAGHQDADVYQALSGALAPHVDEDLRPIDVCNVVWSFCTVGYRDDELFSRLCDSHLTRPALVEHFNAQDLSNTTWGFSKVGFMHEAAMHELARGGLRRRGELQAIHISNFLYSFAMLRLSGPEGFLSAMADCAVEKLASFDCGNLAISVWALAQLRERHDFLDRALGAVQRPELCSGIQSRTLSMLFLAYFRFGRPADVDAVFSSARSCGVAIGSSGFSAAVMTAEQGDDAGRELRLLDAMAAETDDERMRAAIGNSAAIRLAKRGRLEEACRRLAAMKAAAPRRWSAVSGRLLARLAQAAGSAEALPPEALAEEKEAWEAPVKSGLHPIAATRQNEGPHAYTREFMTLQAVLCGAPQGDVDACMVAVEEFAESRSLWLKITAWEKATVVHEVARLARPKLVLEIGAYVGYSAMNLARAVRPHGGRVVSIEVDPIHVTIVRNMVEYAGMSDSVDVWTGYCYDVIPHLLDTYGPQSFGMVFMDQKGTRFHTDLELLERLGLLADGAVILADNVLKPGAPLYIWHLANGPYTGLTAVSVREFLLQSEDWMVMGFHDASRPPAMPPPPLLHRLAFESDAFRKRSMFDSVAPSKADWWSFSQRFVDGLDCSGVKPRIVGLHGRDNPVIQPADVANIFRHAGRLPPT